MTADDATREQVLREAARTALAAPSIFNTQPWRWQADRDKLCLYADRQRQLLVADPAGRLLTVSCGVALHHARIALAATGHDVQVRRVPDPADPDLLAELRIVGPHEPALAELQAREAIKRRRTDRRPFTSQLVTDAQCRTLIVAGEREHAHVHLVGAGQVAALASAAAQAGALELSDRDYRAELADWTHRPPWSGEGVPTETTVRAVPRRVPIRDYVPFGGQTMYPGRDTDSGARFLMVFTDDDTPAAWLRAGEAMSAVLLTAAVEGLGSAPISDVTEVAGTRDELRRLLPGLGEPQLCVRVGHAPPGDLPAPPRRLFEESINPDIVDTGQA
ncbi:Acg family FMN-binding oxidoreductase [Catellatospora chokoriensis]|uniref:NAD(P)H nitroreductase n=1 Tax=Catellatospora chokoriensis TaxID=310353 RepID=A0A8J3NXM6_9ACTN|nr:nitroreductase family protein [Catellatospora chokoriensis]GIF94460.1 NAD(P)H nitroreductase [Catellatospora chokoriensis]